MYTLRNILIDAKRKIENQDNWCSNKLAYATDAQGVRCRAADRRAVKFSATGSLLSLMTDTAEALGVIDNKSINIFLVHVESLTEHHKVMRVYDECIKDLS